MKQLILSLMLVVACGGCSGGFKSAQSQPDTQLQTPISIITTALPSATKGAAYSATLTAKGGTAPYTWSIATGQLPAGLTLTTAGAISGTPTVSSGEFNFTVQVKDSAPAPAVAQARAACAKAR